MYIFSEDFNSEVYNFLYNVLKTQTPTQKEFNSKNAETGLELCKIQVDEAYLNKWNESCRDFVCLAVNGELLRPTLYRVGGMGDSSIRDKDYFLLLKYTEAYYDKDIIESARKRGSKTDGKHLEGEWCIIDKFGKERFVAPRSLDRIGLVSNSLLYNFKDYLYNIETGYCYGKEDRSMDSEEFYFMSNKYDKDKSKRGIYKINKKDGSFEHFK